MSYLKKDAEIRSLIDQLAEAKIIWVDIETADWQTSHPRLSLIQVLTDSIDRTGQSTYILDMLAKPELAGYFIQEIMANGQIEKVFHNASYDLRFLGKAQAQNVTCTLKMARKISHKSPSTGSGQAWESLI